MISIYIHSSFQHPDRRMCQDRIFGATTEWGERAARGTGNGEQPQDRKYRYAAVP